MNTTSFELHGVKNSYHSDGAATRAPFLSLPASLSAQAHQDEIRRHKAPSVSWCAGDNTEEKNNIEKVSRSLDDDYYQIRQQYRKFMRSFGTQPPQIDENSSQDPYRFEFFYPSPSIFRWRHTNSYWTAITFILGSLLFTFNAAMGVRAPHWSESTINMMESWPNFIGGCFFCLGCHASYMQMINVPTGDSDKARFLIADWKEVRKNVHDVSIIGTMSYYIGAVLFQLGCILPILPIHGGSDVVAWNNVKHVVIGVPNVLGGILFVAGAVCEILHNRCFRAGGATWRDVVWWAANLNFVGGVLFFVGSVPGMCLRNWLTEREFELWVDGCFLVGSAIFIVSSILLLLMWQSNDFGLTLLAQLNKAIQAGAHVSVVPPGSSPSSEEAASPDGVVLRVEVAEEAHIRSLQEPKEKAKFSYCGLFFVLVYCWLTFVAIVDVMCQQLWYEFSFRKHFIRETTEVLMQVVICMAIFLILALQSAVPHLPREQPYRAATIMTRVLGLAAAVLQTMTFVDFCANPFDKPPPVPIPVPEMIA